MIAGIYHLTSSAESKMEQKNRMSAQLSRRILSLFHYNRQSFNIVQGFLWIPDDLPT